MSAVVRNVNAMSESTPTLRLYVDGFNLYHRRLKSNPVHKWLDIVALAGQLFPKYNVDRVKFFTARIKPGFATDPRAPLRQQIYLRALQSNTKVDVIFGAFRRETPLLRLHPPAPAGKPSHARVIVNTEKRSDVNLAAHMVFDALTTEIELLIVLTNDSDQVGTLTMLSERFPGRIAIVFPDGTGRHNKELAQIPGIRILTISDNQLLQSQLPDKFADRHGTIVRPDSWS